MKPYKKSGDKLKELTDKLEQGVEELFDSEQYKNYLKTMSKFTGYSISNSILIYMQRPDASHVAGYKAWQKNFNRHVKRGENGITIFAPCPYKEKVEQVKIDPVTKKTVSGKEGLPEVEQVEVTRMSFRPVSVFDVGQTEGEPLPTLGVDELEGSVKDYAAFFEALKKTSPFPIEFEKISSGAKGYCSFIDGRIAINEDMSEVQNVKTAIHEITHAQLHDYYSVAEKDIPEENKKGRHTREVEAESVAYVVCQHYGIDTSEYSFPYVAGWESHNKEILKNSLSVIRETADNLITNIDTKFQEIVQTQEQSESIRAAEPDVSATPEKSIQQAASTEELEKIMGNLTGKNISLTGTDLKLMKRNMQQLHQLCKEYGIHFAEVATTNARKYLGEVNRSGRYADKVSIHYPRQYYKDTDLLTNELRKSAAEGSMPKIGSRNADIYTTTHEFGHTLSCREASLLYGFDTKFWDEMEPLYLDYKKNGGDILGKYASKNQDEFLAEAFAEAKLSAQPCAYAEKALAIVDKYFQAPVLENQFKDMDSAKPENTPEEVAQEQTHTVCIYQLKDTPECAKALFLGWESLQNYGGFQPENYHKIWEGELRHGGQQDFLEEIYTRFNLNQPADFTGHSLSVSDVVTIDNSAYFVDNVGFQSVQMEAPTMELQTEPMMELSM